MSSWLHCHSVFVTMSFSLQCHNVLVTVIHVTMSRHHSVLSQCPRRRQSVILVTIIVFSSPSSQYPCRHVRVIVSLSPCYRHSHSVIVYLSQCRLRYSVLVTVTMPRHHSVFITVLVIVTVSSSSSECPVTVSSPQCPHLRLSQHTPGSFTFHFCFIMSPNWHLPDPTMLNFGNEIQCIPM